MKYGGVYKKKRVLKERDPDRNIRKKRIRTRTLREESEQCNFLCDIDLLGQACI